MSFRLESGSEQVRPDNLESKVETRRFIGGSNVYRGTSNGSFFRNFDIGPGGRLKLRHS